MRLLAPALQSRHPNAKILRNHVQCCALGRQQSG